MTTIKTCWEDFSVWRVNDHAWDCELEEGHEGPHQKSGKLELINPTETISYKLIWENI